jgi:hypothetical protein
LASLVIAGGPPPVVDVSAAVVVLGVVEVVEDDWLISGNEEVWGVLSSAVAFGEAVEEGEDFEEGEAVVVEGEAVVDEADVEDLSSFFCAMAVEANAAPKTRKTVRARMVGNYVKGRLFFTVL